MVVRIRRFLSFILVFLALLAALSWFALKRQDDWLRPLLEDAIAQRLTRPVRLKGAVLDFATAPTLVLSGLQIGEPGSPLISIASLRIRISEPARLMEGQVDSIAISGVKARLDRDRDGQWSLAGLVRGGDEPAQAWHVERLSAQAVALEIGLLPSAGPLRIHLGRLEFGPLAPGGRGEFAASLNADMTEPSLANASAQASGSYVLGPDGVPVALGSFRLSGEANTPEARFSRISLALAGVHRVGEHFDLQGFELAGVAQPQGGSTLQFAVSAPRIQASSAGASSLALGVAVLRIDQPAMRARLGLARFSLQHGGVADAMIKLNAQAPMQEGLATTELEGRVHGDFASASVALDEARLRGSLPLAKSSSAVLDVGLAGWLRVRPESEQAAELDFDGRFDRTRMNGELNWQPSRSVPLHISASAGQIDLDRYMTKATPAKANAGAVLPDWRSLPVALDLRVGELRSGGMIARKARLLIDPEPAARPAQRRAE